VAFTRESQDANHAQITDFKPNIMTKFFRRLAIVLFSMALLGIALLWITDASPHLLPAFGHLQYGAMPLILIGLSYVSFQLSGRRALAERTKGLLLGLAFILWGSEQLLPPSAWVTAMDSLVIAHFRRGLGPHHGRAPQAQESRHPMNHFTMCA
jgi:hypothetical protein